MNNYSVKYRELATGKLTTGVYQALSITHLIHVMEYKFGYVPDVVQLVKL